MMACEAFYSILTPSTKPHEAQYSKQSLNTCSFPARFKLSPRRRLSTSAPKSKPAGFGKKTKKNVEDDPWESLFKQLEKDLENDTDDSNEEEITEEDVANFERELDMVVEELANASNIGTVSELDDMLAAHSKDMIKNDDECDNDDKEGIEAKKFNENEGAGVDDDDEDDDEGIEYSDDEYFSDDDLEEPRKVTLQPWQLRKLAAAAELGRRKVHVKSLTAELQLDRDDVLSFLKNPPPELLMAASEIDEKRGEEREPIYDKEDDSASKDETKEFLVPKDPDADQAVSSTRGHPESHDMKRRTFGPRDWIKGKRLKKVNLATLERVYKRTKWPSNAMIESMVRATNLPRMRILEWFEEERAKSGTQEPPRQSRASRRTWKRPVTHSFERLQ